MSLKCVMKKSYHSHHIPHYDKEANNKNNILIPFQLNTPQYSSASTIKQGKKESCDIHLKVLSGPLLHDYQFPFMIEVFFMIWGVGLQVHIIILIIIQAKEILFENKNKSIIFQCHHNNNDDGLDREQPPPQCLKLIKDNSVFEKEKQAYEELLRSKRASQLFLPIYFFCEIVIDGEEA